MLTLYLRSLDNRLKTENRSFSITRDNCGAHPHSIQNLDDYKDGFFPKHNLAGSLSDGSGIIKNLEHFDGKECVRKKIASLDIEEDNDIILFQAVLQAAGKYVK